LVVAVLSAATVGAVLASRRPAHPVGWLLLAVGLSEAFLHRNDQYLIRQEPHRRQRRIQAQGTAGHMAAVHSGRQWSRAEQRSAGQRLDCALLEGKGAADVRAAQVDLPLGSEPLAARQVLVIAVATSGEAVRAAESLS
jgi:hypothetical protein